jgi:GSH-dependent disulfide-bond oxidoreductase
MAEFRTINPNGEAPAIVDTEGPGGTETRLLDPIAILFYLGEKTSKLMGSPRIAASSSHGVHGKGRRCRR